jgi:hypothetical protein
MTEAESHTLAWLRRIDGKLDGLAVELAALPADLAQVKEELVVQTAVILRLDAREVAAKGLLAMLERVQQRREALDSAR